LTVYAGPERRSKPRIREAFPVKVMGKDSTGQTIESEIRLENLSASGLYLVLQQNVVHGTELAFILRFISPSVGEESAARVSARGVVVRVEPKCDGTQGLAVAFKSHRVL
jgi:PilZ domain